MDTYSQVAWERLGSALKQRRVALGYGYRRRGDFARDTGMGGKTLQRLENGERSFYPAETIAQAEAAYQLEPGSVADCLRGGKLRPLPESGETPITDPDEYELAILASDRLSYSEKVTEIHRHRERIAGEARKLAALGIVPPAFLRGGVKRLAGESESASSDEARQA